MTHYLCDIENIYHRWARLIAAADPGDKLSLFYSDKTGSIKTEALGPACLKGLNLNFVQCDNGRPNALDFQLVSALGWFAATEPAGTRYIIVTGDAGFMSVIDFWARRNVQVSVLDPASLPDFREPEIPAPQAPAGYSPPPYYGPMTGFFDPLSAFPTEPVYGQPPSVPEPKPEPLVTVSSVRQAYMLKLKDYQLGVDDTRIMAGILIAAMRRPANKRKLDCMNRIKARYGRSQGQALYNQIKNLVHNIADNGPLPPPENQETANDSKPENQPSPNEEPAKPPQKPTAPPGKKRTTEAIKQALSKTGIKLTAREVRKLINVTQNAATCNNPIHILTKQTKEVLHDNRSVQITKALKAFIS